MAWPSGSSILGLGFVLGLKHALEADHLAAISTMATEQRSLLSSSLVGALWGLGHTASVLIAGVAVIGLHYEITASTGRALECCVGIMLIILGANVLRSTMRQRASTHMHHCAAQVVPGAGLRGGLGLSARPLVVGIVHGLAGSAALMLLAVATVSSPSAGFLYLAIFGIGSIAGMMLMSALVGLSAQLTAVRYARAYVAVRTMAGLLSISLGLFVIYEIGFAGHLFA